MFKFKKQIKNLQIWVIVSRKRNWFKNANPANHHRTASGDDNDTKNGNNIKLNCLTRITIHDQLPPQS